MVMCNTCATEWICIVCTCSVCVCVCSHRNVCSELFNYRNIVIMAESAEKTSGPLSARSCVHMCVSVYVIYRGDGGTKRLEEDIMGEGPEIRRVEV